MRHLPPIALLLGSTGVLVLALACGAAFRAGLPALLATAVLAVGSGFVSRSWWVVPTLAFTIIAGVLARVGLDLDWQQLVGMPRDPGGRALILQAAFAYSASLVMIALLLSGPVALGIWLGKRVDEVRANRWHHRSSRQ